MERFVGKYCKFITKEPGEDRVNVVSGTLEEVDYCDGFIIVNSYQGLGCLRIDTIIAIKPGNKNRIKKKTPFGRNSHAMVGIGTLIIFIAMVLVAAVASSVIIQTSESLQQRAQAVGKQTIRQVSSGMEIVDVTGYTNADKTRIEYIAISIKPRAGSYDIDLNETLMYIEHNNLTILSLNWQNASLSPGSVASSVHADGVFHTLNFSTLNRTNFGIIGIRDSDQSIYNSFGMSTDDLAVIIVNLSAVFNDTNGLLPGKDFIGRLVPEVGSSGIFLCSTPSAFDYRVVEL